MIHVEIKRAETQDASIIHDLMIRAYTEYKQIPASSTALDETVETILKELKDGEQGFILYIEKIPVAAVRYHLREDDLFFSRLSVVPEQRSKGLARTLLNELEAEAFRKNKATIRCKVRKSLDRNMKFYESFGYRQFEQTIFPLKGLDIEVAEMEKSVPTI